MFFKLELTLIILFGCCSAQNILNFLDFAAPLFGLLKAGTPEVCYNELGCFRNDGPFSASTFRPISCVPQSPQIIGTEFLFYSRKFPEEPQEIEALDTDLFHTIDFDPKKSTKIVIHGYKEGLLIHGFSHDVFELLKDGLLYDQDSNVILVRWSRGASSFYFQSVANCRVVAAQVAQLINYLISERKARPESFHLIGFSLGAHISGYVGKRIQNLGRITALDTAKPYFDGVPQVVRLDRRDAINIDAFHTDNGIGTEREVGSVDIYFNGGNRQPGCDRQVMETLNSDGLLDAIFDTISCDHKRALHYYVDYLLNRNRGCIPIAYRCQNWHQFKSGQCTSCGQRGEKCIIVGLNTELNSYLSPQTDNKYFILTNERQPFCVHQYLVRMTTHWSKATIDGEFHIRLRSHNNTFKDYKSGHFQQLSGKQYSFIISSETPLHEITAIDLTFVKRSPPEESPHNLVSINSIKLMPLNIIDDNEKRRNSITYCTSDTQWLSNSNNTFISLRSQNCF